MTAPGPIIEVINEDEIVRRRRELLREAGLSHAELTSLARDYELDQHGQAALRQIDQLDFLMSDDTDQHYAAIARVNSLYNDTMVRDHVSDDLALFLADLRDAIGERLHRRHTSAAENAEEAHRLRSATPTD